MRQRYAIPANRRINVAMIIVKVARAFLTLGSRKAGTPLLTASTPVIAVQPLENAFTSSHALTAATAGSGLGVGTTGTGCPPWSQVFQSPTTITAPSEPTNT